MVEVRLRKRTQVMQVSNLADFLNSRTQVRNRNCARKFDPNSKISKICGCNWHRPSWILKIPKTMCPKYFFVPKTIIKVQNWRLSQANIKRNKRFIIFVNVYFIHRNKECPTLIYIESPKVSKNFLEILFFFVQTVL